jgi:hypothetical protein
MLGDVGDEPRGGALAVGAGHGHDRQVRGRQLGALAEGDGTQRPQLAPLAGRAQCDSGGGCADGLRDRAPSPRKRDGSPQPIVRVAHGEPRLRQVQAGVQAPDDLAGLVRHRRGVAGIGTAELELDGGPDEEPIRPIQHAQLEQLSPVRGGGVRHGRQYTHAPCRPRPT